MDPFSENRRLTNEAEPNDQTVPSVFALTLARMLIGAKRGEFHF
jgi:hypothetical protein